MAGSIYQTVFGGNTVAPAIPTYLSLSISANVILGWPLESNITAPAAAEIIDVTATVGGLTIQLSDARQVGVGYCALFNNVGANTFSVLDASGATIASIASGQAWQIYISDNSTLAGTWRVFQYGAGTSSANAATLAGNGLKAITTTLNERIFINAQGSNYAIQNTDRAACVEWTGGSGGTFTAPTPATVGSDWFCYIKNAGTGVLTLSPATGNIDGTSSKSFNPNDSCILISDGANLFTMGFGQSVASSFNFVTISLAGASGNVVLNGAQLNRISYKFTGALAGNTVVVVPASIQQYWIDNETTGAFTLTISAGGAGTTFTVPQANRTILYCDGLNIVNAISSGSIQFADGTAAAPSITFASDLTLGFYKAGADVLGISTAGVQRGVVNASGQWVINAPNSGTALTITSLQGIAATFIGPNTGAGYNIDFFDSTNAAFRGFIGIGTNTVGGAVVTDFAISPGVGGSVVIGTANGGAIATRFGPNGNVTINAPSSGTTLTVTGIASQYAGFFTGGGAAGTQRGLSVVTSTQNAADKIFNVNNSISNLCDIFADGHGDLGPNLSWSAGGAWTIGVPTSGQHVINSFGFSTALQLGFQASGSTAGWMQFQDITNSTVRGYVGFGSSLFTGAAITDFGIAGQSGTLRLSANGGANTHFGITNAGVISGLGPVAAALVDMTPDSSSWTTTLSGSFSVNPTGTMNWKRNGNLVTVYTTAAILGTQTGGNTISASALPASITPGATRQVPCIVEQNGGTWLGLAQVNSNNTITFLISLTNSVPQPTQFSTFTATANNGLPAGFSISYSL